MVEQRRLRFTGDGSRAVLRTHSGLRVASLSSTAAPVDIAIPDLVQFATFDDQIWCVVGDEPTLVRFDLGGNGLGDPLPLPDVGAPGRLQACPFGAPAAVWAGARVVEIAERGSKLSLHHIDGEADFVVPLLPGQWIAAHGKTLTLRDAARDRWSVTSHTLAAGTVMAGSSLMEGRSVAVVAQHDGGHVLLVISTRDGNLQHRLKIADVTAARFAPRRNYAFLRTGDRTLVAVDLRFGRLLKKLAETRPIFDLDVDGAAQYIGLVLRTDAGRELPVHATFREFLAADEPAPAKLNAETEHSEGSDARTASRIQADVDGARARRREQLVRVATPRPPPPPIEDDPPLVIPKLGGLWPRPIPALCDRSRAIALLGRQLRWCAARCELAIARDWNSGRIAFPDATDLPYESEVSGLVGRSRGIAEEHVDNAALDLDHAVAELNAALADLGDRISPLTALSVEFGLTDLAADILLTVAAPVLWGELARLYAVLANDQGRPVCDELLIWQILGPERATRYEIARELDSDRPLLRFGLMRAAPGARPFVSLSADELVIRMLRADPTRGIPGDRAVSRPAARAIDELAIPPRALGPALADLAHEGPDGYARVVLRGRVGSGRHTLAAALADAAQRTLEVIDASLLQGEARKQLSVLRGALMRSLLRGGMPCIDGLDILAGDERGVGDEIREIVRTFPGPLAIRLPWNATPPIDPGYVLIDIPPLTETERTAHWHRTLARFGLSVSDVDVLAARYRIGPGVMERVAAKVAAARERNGAAADSSRAIDEAVRQHLEIRLGSIATRVPRLATWSSVVLPPDVIDSLLELIARVRHRKTVYDQWGFDRRVTSSRGLTVLFQGAPGTGKSMVAGAVASELGLDLYRVDLSRVMSKWIGETERNLAEVFDAAEDGQAIILFDEADSLFSKRTEVKSSVDRYANLEVNYLLQRLDSFEGIAILTTNFGASIDNAFKRRMSLRLTFPFPDEEMREQLWRVHLPPELPTAGEFDLAALAKSYQLSGGYIRNATLRAAFLAAEEQSPLTHEHLERAIRLEYREIGKLATTGVLE